MLKSYIKLSSLRETVAASEAQQKNFFLPQTDQLQVLKF